MSKHLGFLGIQTFHTSFQNPLFMIKSYFSNSRIKVPKHQWKVSFNSNLCSSIFPSVAFWLRHLCSLHNLSFSYSHCSLLSYWQVSSTYARPFSRSNITEVWGESNVKGVLLSQATHVKLFQYWSAKNQPVEAELNDLIHFTRSYILPKNKINYIWIRFRL